MQALVEEVGQRGEVAEKLLRDQGQVVGVGPRDGGGDDKARDRKNSGDVRRAAVGEPAAIRGVRVGQHGHSPYFPAP